MFKNKLITAGVLSISALAFSLPAMATMGFGNRNYNGRYACHEDDGAGTASPTNDVGGVTGTYTVQPNGCGAYNGGELVFNASYLWDNPCTFALETSGDDVSSYTVDAGGVVHETLYWLDDNWDACYGIAFTQSIEASLSLPSPYQAANHTLTTSNINFVLDSTAFNFAGTGECISSAP
jgi:hypothetical protein